MVLPNVDTKARLRIVGGVEPPASNRSYMVALFQFDANGEEKLFCSGALISQRLAVTSARCGLQTNITVRMGAENASDGEELFVQNTFHDP